MELVAARRPFIYVPLAHHFEQQIHVAHRLAQYRAGKRLDYAALDPGYLAEAIVAEIDRRSITGRGNRRRRAGRGPAG